ncbi:hypothetical protein [Roseovarius sp. Pro17]|uniref:hypothetical protein n=1 Tax=Roseovarius sp. Pro17 TaxID=3108175 RepID=UPI002D768B6C|nr:hypothetical protein [Roseovarius sp. Pro17]
MMIHSPSSFMSDALAQEARKAAILREAAMPDAPLAMPRQVIEVPRAKAMHAEVSGLRRMLSVLAQGFGLTARGR